MTDNYKRSEEEEPNAGSKGGLHRAVHLQAASRENDNPIQDAAIMSMVLLAIAVVVTIYAEWNLSFVTTRNIDDLIVAIIIFVGLPWIWLALHATGSINRAGRRKAALVNALEDAIKRDLDGDGRIGAPIANNWFTQYVGSLYQGFPTTREAARKDGLSDAQWRAAKEELINSGLAIPTKVNNLPSFKLKPADLHDLTRRLPQQPPAIRKQHYTIETGAAFMSEESIRERVSK